MERPEIIQGGMGVGVSDWRLARAVSRMGELGVVSGTGINTVLIRRLQDGDNGGHVRRAVKAFPDRECADTVLRSYFLEKGRPEGKPYKRSPLPSLRSNPALDRLNVLAGFVEVYLAKEGHEGLIGINLLEKLQLTNLPVLYGAMLAGVDFVLMGAGIPREIPGALDRLSGNQKTSLKIHVLGKPSELGDAEAWFDPREVFPALPERPLKRPYFLGVVSSATLAAHLARKSTGRVDGFVVEGATAGGHNAPPRGPLRLSPEGEPIYGPKDSADLAAFRELDLPFWLAGSYGSPGRLREARDVGACGIQVGTAFAFCDESGITRSLKDQVIAKVLDGQEPDFAARDLVFTDPLASPTGFPFKVVELEGTLSDSKLYEERPRKCDLGYLRQAVRQEDGKIEFRCPSEPVADYLKKEGAIEDTKDRKCLCNALMSNIGFGQTQEADYRELALLTAGDDLASLKDVIPLRGRSYSAGDVIHYLRGPEAVGQP